MYTSVCLRRAPCSIFSSQAYESTLSELFVQRFCASSTIPVGPIPLLDRLAKEETESEGSPPCYVQSFCSAVSNVTNMLSFYSHIHTYIHTYIQ